MIFYYYKRKFYFFMDLLKDLQQKANIKSNSKTDKNITEMFYHSKEWRQVRKEVIKRDKKECQVCKSLGKVTVNNLLVHHIYILEYYYNKRLDIDNLVTVCHSCHELIHNRYKVNKWKEDEYF